MNTPVPEALPGRVEEGTRLSVPSPTHLAESMLKQLVLSIGATAVANWIQPSARFDYDAPAATLNVLTPNRFMADFIDRKYGAAMQDAAAGVLGTRPEVLVSVDAARFGAGADQPMPSAGSAMGRSNQLENRMGQAASSAASGSARHDALGDPRPASPSARTQQAGKNPASAGPASLASGGRKHGLKRTAFRHKLEDYVVGPANELAYSAAMLMAERPDDAPSPLFLHGGCGLGKTHLLQGICRQTFKRNPRAKIHYTTGESFTNAYIQAVTTGKIDAFRAKYRGLDLLAIDDVHFIAGKKKTQMEFYHCLDELLDGGAKIVMASDSHPRDIAAFTEALVSRCVAGLVAEIRPLDTDSLIKLALLFAARRGLRMPHQVAERLAMHYGQSARDLEGAITKMQAMSMLNIATTPGTPERAPGRGPVAQPEISENAPTPSLPTSGGGVGHAMVDRMISEEQGRQVTRPVGFGQLVTAAAEAVGVAPQQIMSKTRVRPVVLARDIAIHLSRQMTSMSYPEIARALGRSNHSTVITAAQRFDKQLKENAELIVPACPTGTVRLERLVDETRRKAVQG